MNRKQNFQSISWFWDLYTRQRLHLDPPYQRRSVWNQAYKDYFIDTVLLNYPAPAIFLYEVISTDGRSDFYVVDGKQRLTTLFEFINNEFPISDKAVKTEIRGKYFNELEDNSIKEFWSYNFSVEYLPTSEDSVINNIFDRINRNTFKLSPQEIRHARFDGEFITAAEDLAKWMLDKAGLLQRFPKIPPKDLRQMKEVEFVAHLLLLLEVGPQGLSLDQMDAAFCERDTEWDRKDEIIEKFKNTTNIIKQLLETDPGERLVTTRLRNRLEFYSLFGAINQLQELNNLPDLDECASKLLRFIEIVEDEEKRDTSQEAIEYFKAATVFQKDTAQRKTRLEILKKILADGT